MYIQLYWLACFAQKIDGGFKNAPEKKKQKKVVNHQPCSVLSEICLVILPSQGWTFSTLTA